MAEANWLAELTEEDQLKLALSVSAPAPSSQTKICKYFLRGFCGNGVFCKFEHPEPGGTAVHNAGRGRGTRLVPQRLPEPGPKNPGLSNRAINALPCFTYQNCAAPPDEQTCTICLEEFENGTWIRALPCLHKFHLTCANDWLVRSTTCPQCQTNFA
eukprot:TRINITY_DN12380_c0_g1_i1.p1 TRINITY_DN12380_c0_g1~~TRINITY_DN12380_c0_g1_i1.p1  ORF type:complete len:165 (-),score=13.78 TRINITY_DN12380_c0_g1_i1:37-507(-)